MKTKTSFVCANCGYESPKWLGRCSQCGEWDTMEEKTAAVPAKAAAAHQRRRPSLALEQERPRLVADVDCQAVSRLDLGLEELNRVLGGGLVPGTLVLLAGDPGIGKSTPVSYTHLNSYFYKMLPFAATLIVLVFTSKRSQAPRASGTPYEDVYKRQTLPSAGR